MYQENKINSPNNNNVHQTKQEMFGLLRKEIIPYIVVKRNILLNKE
jgi:hypothetical protein